MSKVRTQGEISKDNNEHALNILVTKKKYINNAGNKEEEDFTLEVLQNTEIIVLKRIERNTTGAMDTHN